MGQEKAAHREDKRGYDVSGLRKQAWTRYTGEGDTRIHNSGIKIKKGDDASQYLTNKKVSFYRIKDRYKRNKRK